MDALKSSLHDLPDEILTEILLLGRPLSPLEDSFLYPLRVSSVCVLWRSLALSCRDLWTNVLIIIDLYRQKPAEYEGCMHTYLERSSHAPLFVQIQFDDPPRHFSTLPPLVAKEQHRLKTLWIFLPNTHSPDSEVPLKFYQRRRARPLYGADQEIALYRSYSVIRIEFSKHSDAVGPPSQFVGQYSANAANATLPYGLIIKISTVVGPDWDRMMSLPSHYLSTDLGLVVNVAFFFSFSRLGSATR